MIGIKVEETSNLAEHHYLVAMIGRMLAEYINEEDKLVDPWRVVQMCLIHDVGEIFGGDTAAPLSRRRPDMKKHARTLEAFNHEIVASFLRPKLHERWNGLIHEHEDMQSDEAVVAQVADKIETQYFLEHRDNKSSHRKPFYEHHIRTLAERVRYPVVRVKLNAFFDAYEKHVRDKGFHAGDLIYTDERP